VKAYQNIYTEIAWKKIDKRKNKKEKIEKFQIKEMNFNGKAFI